MEERKIIEYALIALVYIVVMGGFAFSLTKVDKQNGSKDSRADSNNKSGNHTLT